MIVRFLAPARAELWKAVDYFNMQSEGLGFEFAAEVKRSIADFGQHWCTIEGCAAVAVDL